ncbi:MAG: glycosyltransferase [Halobacteriota archaeon]
MLWLIFWICHEGQGTLQSAIHCGTPVVGVAAQAEQFINFYNIELRGAGIRISVKKWRAENIQEAVHKISVDKPFKAAAMGLKERMESMDGQEISAQVIWKKILGD